MQQTTPNLNYISQADHDNQWNPAYGGTTAENAVRQKIINAIHAKKNFRFKNDPNETVYAIKGYKTKRIF